MRCPPETRKSEGIAEGLNMTIVSAFSVDVLSHRVMNFFLADDESPMVQKHIPPQGGYKSVDTEDSGTPRKKPFTLYTSSAGAEWIPGTRGAHKSWAQREGFSRLIKHGLKVVNHHAFKIDQVISDEELWYELHKYLPEAYEGLGIGYPRDIDRELERAVRQVRRYWRPEVYPEIQLRARAAGLKGKKYSMSDFLETQGMSRAQAFRHLNATRGVRSIRTVDAMRREFANLDRQTGEIDDG